jgi:hypothetical protein
MWKLRGAAVLRQHQLTLSLILKYITELTPQGLITGEETEELVETWSPLLQSRIVVHTYSVFFFCLNISLLDCNCAASRDARFALAVLISFASA